MQNGGQSRDAWLAPYGHWVKVPLTGGFNQQEHIVQSSVGPRVKDQSLGSARLPLNPVSGTPSERLPPVIGQGHSLQARSDFLSTSIQSSLWICLSVLFFFLYEDNGLLMRTRLMHSS